MQEIKDYLKITWEDEDASLERLIERGTTYLSELTGADLNFDVEGLPKSLLFDYCRYVYNNAAEFFEENFREQILRLQLLEAVKANGVEG